MIDSVRNLSSNTGAGLLEQAGNRFKSLAGSIARGLRSVLSRASDGDPPQFGVRYQPRNGDQVQASVAGYRVLGDKAKGVEPGFIAKRDWDARDTGKMLDPEHRFNARAMALLDAWLYGGQDDDAGTVGLHDVGPGDEVLQRVAQQALMRLAEAGGAHGERALGLLHLDEEDEPRADVLASLRKGKITEEFDQALRAEMLRYVAERNLPDEDGAVDGDAATLAVDLCDRIMAAEARFDKLHYIKLDYYEADKFRGNYLIPKDKAKGNWLMRIVHRLYTGAPPKDRNEGAVREALANDLMRALGIQSQKLKLVEGRYQDGTVKLLLDGTHVDGFRDFDGDPGRGQLYLKDGVLVRNSRLASDPEGTASGPAELYTGMRDLGRNKILLLLMADRDALGSRGANKGYVGDTFVGIDPGHALEEGLLKRQDDLRSDFSFKQPSRISSRGYKNFTMFDQSTLAEKMEGVRMIQRLKDSGDDARLFDTYAEAFGQGRPEEADFGQAIDRMKTLYEGRRDYVLRVFSERLAVDGFEFGVAPDLHNARRDQALNLLDGLEKLTSKTVGSTAKSEGVALEFPQIASPGDRREWHIRQAEGGDIVFEFQGSRSQVRGAQDAMYAFLDAHGLSDFAVERSDDEKALAFTVSPEDLPGVADIFDHRNLMAYKHSA